MSFYTFDYHLDEFGGKKVEVWKLNSKKINYNADQTAQKLFSSSVMEQLESVNLSLDTIGDDGIYPDRKFKN